MRVHGILLVMNDGCLGLRSALILRRPEGASKDRDSPGGAARPFSPSERGEGAGRRMRGESRIAGGPLSTFGDKIAPHPNPLPASGERGRPRLDAFALILRCPEGVSKDRDEWRMSICVCCQGGFGVQRRS
ncbi:hypothetical protein C0075_16890 [Rhizobium sp. KAs_5_22]|nr:hypothetical protein C0075_16890 [Rhizobium sp. KAs_5_22]